jgi:hypothetical protein
MTNVSRAPSQTALTLAMSKSDCAVASGGRLYSVFVLLRKLTKYRPPTPSETVLGQSCGTYWMALASPA